MLLAQGHGKLTVHVRRLLPIFFRMRKLLLRLMQLGKALPAFGHAFRAMDMFNQSQCLLIILLGSKELTAVLMDNAPNA